MNSIKPGPVLFAACGAVVGLYCLGAFYRAGFIGMHVLLALVFVPVAVLCFFRTLVSFFRMRKQETPRSLRLWSVYSVAFAAGLAIGTGAGSSVTNKVSFGIPNEAVRALSGVLLDDPRLISGGRVMAMLSLRESAGSRGLRVSAKGEIPFFFPEESASRLREFGRGTRVFAEGNIRQGRGGYTFSAESLHIERKASTLERFRTGVRLGVVGRFNRAAGGGEASWGGLALALLLGIRDTLDTGLAALYRDAGCSYVLALSGMHLAVLASLIALILKKPLGLKPAAVAGAAIIVLYCFIVGPLPSLTRAALMYLIGVIAVLGFLKRDGLSLLGMAFIIQIVINPASGFSISFILSYLALAGILIIGESLNYLFWGKVPDLLLQPLAASVGAFLATAGVSAFFFGALRPVGMVTGLVLVPLTTVFMIGSMAWFCLDCISPVVSGLLGYPLSLLYAAMEKTVALAGKVPGLTVNPHLVLWLSTGLVVFVVWFSCSRQTARNRLNLFAINYDRRSF
jgi:competence protein ComEC